jgi:hypothetical protein
MRGNDNPPPGCFASLQHDKGEKGKIPLNLPLAKGRDEPGCLYFTFTYFGYTEKQLGNRNILTLEGVLLG